jgi:hypothetical protein
MRKVVTMLIVFSLATLSFSWAFAGDIYNQAAVNFLAHAGSSQSITSIEVLYKNSLAPDLPEIEAGAIVRLDSGYIVRMSRFVKIWPSRPFSTSSRGM